MYEYAFITKLVHISLALTQTLKSNKILNKNNVYS